MWRRGRSRAVAVVAALVALVSTDQAAAVDPFTFGNPAFCAPTKPARDFGFSRLPAVREIPVEAELPFAPPAVNVYGSGSSQVRTERGSFGYGFSE